MKRSLWEITEDFKALESLLDEQQGEICDITEELIKEIDQLLTSKTDGCAEYVLSIEEQSAAIDNRIKDLKTLQQRLETKRIQFLNYIDACMRKTGKEKITGEIYEFGFRKCSPSLLITDENKIPPAFLREEIIIKIESKKILDALKQGEVIEGAEIAPLKKNLQMKLKSLKKEKSDE